MVPIDEIRSLASIYAMGGIVALLGNRCGWGLRPLHGFDGVEPPRELGPGWDRRLRPDGPCRPARRQSCIELLIRVARRLRDGPLSPALMARVNDPLPKFGLLVVMGDLAGIVFIMTVKASLTGSILAVVAFAGLGAALALPAIGRQASPRMSWPSRRQPWLASGVNGHSGRCDTLTDCRWNRYSSTAMKGVAVMPKQEPAAATAAVGACLLRHGRQGRLLSFGRNPIGRHRVRALLRGSNWNSHD